LNVNIGRVVKPHGNYWLIYENDSQTMTLGYLHYLQLLTYLMLTILYYK